MTNLILGLILFVIIGSAARYVYQQKKKGVKCIGCEFSKSCSAESSCPSCASMNKIIDDLDKRS